MSAHSFLDAKATLPLCFLQEWVNRLGLFLGFFIVGPSLSEPRGPASSLFVQNLLD